MKRKECCIECYDGGAKHNFEPRYSEQQRLGNHNISNYNLMEVRDLLTLKIYEKDVCTWCGKTVKKY